MVDGKSLGRVVDLAFTCRGQVFGIIVPGSRRFLRSLSSNNALFIPWANICKIGFDVVLVELTSQQTTRVLGSEEETVEE